MSTRQSILSKSAAATLPSFTPACGGLLQRKCACGGTPGPTGECAECRTKRLQRKTRNAELEIRKDSSVPRIVHDVLRSPGQPLDGPTRVEMENRFGHDFAQVRVHLDANAARSAEAFGALAFSVGRHIVFGAGRYEPRKPGVQPLLVHELAHVVQESDGRGEADRARLEAEADHASGLAPESDRPRRPLRVGGRVLHRKNGAPPAPEVEFAMLLTLNPLSKDDAKKAFEAYKKIPAAKRQAALEAQFKGGELAKLLRALPKDEAINAYPDQLREMLRFIEQASTRATSGMSDDKMAEVQAKFQLAEAQKAAAAAAAAKAPKGAPPPTPTPKEVQQARKERVAKTSIAPVKTAKWDGMDKATKDDWLKRAGKSVDAVVALASKSFPELKLSKANFKVDFPAIEKRGAGVLAFEGGTAALPVAVFGYEFVRAAEADPGYVLGVVVHELFGHREYGPYGTEYHLELYDQAQKKIPGYVKPAEGSTERTAEMDAYAYQETEIYSLLRSLPYSKAIEPKDASKALVGYEPADWAKTRIGIIKSQWDPALAVAIVRGLYQRLLLDPRISGPAINAFRDGVRAHFTADEAKAILK